MGKPTQQQHRLDIQGLRALAVSLVVIFHFLPAALPGGYIGVDVFFAISGFLITAHLLREVESTGKIRLASFWAKRARRLIPAAAVVLVASAAAILFLFPTTAWRQNLTESAWASVYGLNWHLASQSVDYMAADNPASIVQHYWSLSVEEQFYIVWPILILVAVWSASKLPRLSQVSRKRVVIALLVIVFVVSLGYSIYETSRSQPSAYFITTTRAWEFAAGGLAALIPPLMHRGLRHIVLSWLGVALILFAALRFQASSPFPGWIALVPILGTALLLWVGDGESTWSPQYLAKSGVSQLVGDTSYGIYLWHWPLLMVFVELRGRMPGLMSAVALGGVALVLAMITKRFVEDPIRKAPGALRRPIPTFGLLAAAMAVLLAVAIVPQNILNARTAAAAAEINAQMKDSAGCFGAGAIINNCDKPFAITDTVNPEFAQTDTIKQNLDKDHCVTNAPNGSEVSCDFPADGPSVFLYGDSHAGHLTLGLAEAARQNGWNYHEETLSGCAGFESDTTVNQSEKHLACVDWANRMIEQIKSDKSIDLVVVGVRTSTKPNSPDRTAEVLQEFKDSGKQVVVVRETPGLKDTIPPSKGAPTAADCVAEHMDEYDPCAWTPPQWDEWILPAAEQSGVPIIDLRDLVCTEGACHAVIGGTIVYRDSSHFTATFSKTMAPWFADKLNPFLTANR